MGESLLIPQSEQVEAWQFKVGELLEVRKWAYRRGLKVDGASHGHQLHIQRDGYIEIVREGDWLIVINGKVVKLTDLERILNFTETTGN